MKTFTDLISQKIEAEIGLANSNPGGKPGRLVGFKDADTYSIPALFYINAPEDVSAASMTGKDVAAVKQNSILGVTIFDHPRIVVRLALREVDVVSCSWDYTLCVVVIINGDETVIPYRRGWKPKFARSILEAGL